MRSSFCRTLQTGTVILGLVAVAGCSSTSNWKLPGSSWLSWGKSKPAASSVATQTPKNRELPAPPSSLSTPQAAPTYTQGPPPSSAPAGPSSHAPTHNPYGGTQTAPASNPPSTAQGFYSPEYHPPSQPGSAASFPPGASGPGSFAAPTAPPASTSPYAMPAQPCGSLTGGVSDSREHPSVRDSIYAAPASSGGSPTSPYAGSPAAAAPGGWGESAPSDFTRSDTAGGYLPPVSSGDSPAWANLTPPSTASSAPGAAPSPAAAPTGGYRPGSTARTTPFGSHDSLELAEGSGGELPSRADYEASPPGSSSSMPSSSGSSPSSMPAGYLPGAPGLQPSPGGSPPSYPSPNIYR